jgi:hypothetical protein
VSRYKLEWKPQGAIPQDLNMRVTLPDAPPQEKAKTETVTVEPSCGACVQLGLEMVGGSVDVSNPNAWQLTMEPDPGTTSLVITPVGWDPGPYDTIAFPGIGVVDGTKAQWSVFQTAGGARTPTITQLGPSIGDGLQVDFNPATDGGTYFGSQFVIGPIVPDNWQGSAETATFTRTACGNVVVNGPPATVDITMTSTTSPGVGAGYDSSTYTAHYGVESGTDNIEFTFDTSGFPSGAVNWNFDTPADGLYILQSSDEPTTTSLHLVFSFAGGSNVDILRIQAADSDVPSLTAPPVPPDDDGWLLITI